MGLDSTPHQVVAVRPWADPDEGLGELLTVWSAESADDLHRASAETTVLLLTDRRWRGGGRHLVDRIAESGLLTGDQLDLLAMTW